jgi:hypothetical protein
MAGRPAGRNTDNRANSAQFQLILPTGAEHGKNIMFGIIIGTIFCSPLMIQYFIEKGKRVKDIDNFCLCSFAVYF